MKGWILYKRNKQELLPTDHGVNRLLAAATSLQIELDVYRPEQFELVITQHDKKSILLDGARVALPDFLLPRLGAETSYFALAIIRQLEKSGVYTCNNSAAIEIVKDKMLLSQLFAQSDLPFPKTMLVKFPVPIDLVEREIGFPLVIKNISGARGIGIHLCETADSFRDLMELIGTHSGDHQMILQEFVASSYGRDLRVFVLGAKVIGCMKRTAKNSFKANYSLGGEVSPFAITPEIEKLAIDCAALFNLQIAGIDLLFDTQGFKICEANSSPGFKGMELATGGDIARQILKYVVKETKMAAKI
ncbi:TPA: RimK family alpha-L-glutamate ligase [Legionella feeleii]|uniref:Ribosomal protein S6 modification protein n=1 Tax=Legionella feeleii TaxID=453 RepID=A0A0W0TN83_9GAMM|nr:RimK family alpha-L-glutamate ligase [Legionella feeleii]KTC97044.1 glutathione synthase, ribosomal protein S6 modification protein [Legionella feeleii]SPX61655.1 ribosomal protein S6 modification protein [Legionella feeleii]STX37155.1 ribosomal protein S6 modification protein [Legionella feeleii]